MNIELPGSVALILRELNKHGHEAYAVGGCVRDAVMGRIPHDWDITTSAKPEEVKGIFNKTIDTGIQHGTVTVMISKVGYEVTTFRVDGKYEDGRHPKEVEFTASLEEDLKRRDFTINAMAYCAETGLVDMFQGIEDMKRKQIRCVGNPLERFSEDALRILRALRFAAQLDFDIDSATYEAAIDLRDTLKKISRERIQVELEKLLMSSHPEKLKLLYDTGIMEVVFGTKVIGDSYIRAGKEIKKWDIVGQIEQDHYLRWAAVLTGLEESPENSLKGLKFDNKTINIVTKLVVEGKEIPEENQVSIRKHICKVGLEIYPLYIKYLKEVLGCNTDNLSHIYGYIIENGHCLSTKEMAVKGKDLQDIGIAPGKEMGIIIEKLFERVLENPEINEREILLELARKINV